MCFTFSSSVLTVCFSFSSSVFTFLIEMNFNFKSLFAIWSVWGEFVQVVTERQVVEKEVSMFSGENVAGGE